MGNNSDLGTAAIDTVFPQQLRPEVFFPDSQTGTTPQAFLEHLFPSLGVAPDALADAINKALTGHVGPEAQLPMLDVAEAMTALTPAQRTAVDQVSRELSATIKPVLPQLSGETITELSASCLSEQVGEHPEGTVVLVYKTDQTTRLLLLPYIHVDTQTGAPRLNLPWMNALDMPPSGGITSGLSPAAALLKGVAVAQPQTLAAASGQAILDDILKLGETLAFALPEPWGAIASGVLSLFQMLLGANKPDPFAELLHSIENFLEEQEVEKWARTVNDFMGGNNGLQTQLDVLKTTDSNDQTVFINSTFLPMIKTATGAGVSDNVYAAAGGMRDMVTSISQTITSEGRQAFYNSKPLPLEDTLDLAILGQTALLLAFKIEIQLYAQLASLAKGANDDEMFNQLTGAWLDSYAGFEINIKGDGGSITGCVASVTKLLNTAWTARASLVGPIYDLGAIASSQMGSIYVHKGYGFTDAVHEDPSVESPAVNEVQYPIHYAMDTYTGGCCSQAVSHEADLENVRDAYLASLKTGFMTKRQNIIQGWADAITQWSSHMPPQPPKVPPTVATDAKWTGTTPHGSNWVSGNAVAYAVAFANLAGKSGGPSGDNQSGGDQAGPSQRGDFCDWVEITNSAFPTVTLPTDPLNQASARWIYRQFRSGEKSHIIKIVPGNTSTEFVDNED